MFFVLSGYLITRLLQEENRCEGRISLAAFYRRRCFRIFPAAFVYVLVVFLLSPTSRPYVVYAVTYTVSYHPSDMAPLFVHLWSLSVEEQFYLLWPLVLLLRFRSRAAVAWSAILLAAGFRLFLAINCNRYPVLAMHYSFPGNMDSIAAGCLLAIYEPRIRERCAWMADSAAIVIAIPVTAWTLACLCCAGDASVFWGAVPLLIALWVFLLVERKDWILNNPVACTIGVLSYSLYLWQQVFTLERKYSTVAGLLMLAACAIASYTLVEKPMLKLGASIKARKSVSGRPETAALTPIFQTETTVKQ